VDRRELPKRYPVPSQLAPETRRGQTDRVSTQGERLRAKLEQYQ
jgi:hypothetical protein